MDYFPCYLGCNIALGRAAATGVAVPQFWSPKVYLLRGQMAYSFALIPRLPDCGKYVHVHGESWPAIKPKAVAFGKCVATWNWLLFEFRWLQILSHTMQIPKIMGTYTAIPTTVASRSWLHQPKLAASVPATCTINHFEWKVIQYRHLRGQVLKR